MTTIWLRSMEKCLNGSIESGFWQEFDTLSDMSTKNAIGILFIVLLFAANLTNILLTQSGRSFFFTFTTSIL